MKITLFQSKHGEQEQGTLRATFLSLCSIKTVSSPKLLYYTSLCSLKTFLLKRERVGTSLVAQWLRIRLPMQGTQVRSLVQEDPTCRGATKPVCHNY